MKKIAAASVMILGLLPALAVAEEAVDQQRLYYTPHLMSPKEMLFEPETKQQLMALTQQERIESIGYVLELTNKEKQLTSRKIGERAAKVEECVANVVNKPIYKKKDVMAVISDCIVVLGYD